MPLRRVVLDSQPQRIVVDFDQIRARRVDDAEARALFAWICRAFRGDARYNDLTTAIAAVFLVPDEPVLANMRENAMSTMLAGKSNNNGKGGDDDVDVEETPMGEPLSLYERERASLGAMGAAQWTGQFKTRPHALLSVRNLTSVEEWEKTLHRGCRRTLKRALQQNFTVSHRPIRNGHPAPHSSLAHFRCVVDHEVRLLTGADFSSPPQAFFDALATAISRYIGTTQMSGVIREYRDGETGKVLGFAHEVQKGRTVRGQWFYVSEEASKRYVWFHSVRSLVDRAIASDVVDTVDLGPSGSDDFSALKAKYGFVSVDDWPAVADYVGPFWNYEKDAPEEGGVKW